MPKQTFIDIHDEQFYTPSIVPQNIKRHSTEIPHLEVGQAGKVGVLFLSFKNRDGKTLLVDNFHKVPLQVKKALYIDEQLPQMPYIYIMSASGGILQGDRMRIDIHGQKNTMFHITTQSATKIYKMEKNYATQILNITLDKGAYAEFLPDMIIPYKDSRFYQEVNLKIHEDATCLYSEILTPGRVASGESFMYEIFYSRFQATNLSGKYRCIDHTVFLPRKKKLNSFGILGKWDVIGNIFLLTNKVESKLLNSELEGVIQETDNICIASSVLPHLDGVIVRVLGNKSSQVDIVCKKIHNFFREKLIGKSMSNLRK